MENLISLEAGCDRELAEAPELHQDIYALAAKRSALAEFERKLGTDASEREWQDYFEANPWVFGHGLHHVFLDKVGPKLETVTTGSAFDQGGKRIDALMRTRAEISQYVLVEIKRDATKLLQKDQYRSGCWAASSELSAAVTQTQKTVFEFTRDRFHDLLKDEDGNRTGEEVSVIPFSAKRSCCPPANLATFSTGPMDAKTTRDLGSPPSPRCSSPRGSCS